MHLYDFPDSFNALRARSVAFEVGIEPEIRRVNLFAGEHRSPAFLAKNPFGRVPVLEDADLTLSESFAIATYLAAKGGEARLLPVDPGLRAAMDQWHFFAAAHVTPAIVSVFRQRVVHPAMGLSTDEAIVRHGLTELAEVLALIDRRLQGRIWLVDELSVADFSVAAPLTTSRAAQIDLAGYPNVRRWLGQLAERPSWRRSLSGCEMLAP